ncbi:mechanosensitive ion channel family protein [Algoriphagus namhaensis]
MLKVLSRFLSIFLIFVTFLAKGQNGIPASAEVNSVDSVKIKNQIVGANAALDSLFVRTDTLEKKAVPKLGLLLSKIVTNAKTYSIEMGRLKLILEDKPDFSVMEERIPELKQTGVDLENLLIDKRAAANNRFLNGVENFMTYFEGEKDELDQIISNRITELIEISDKLDLIRQDSLIQLSLKDSTLLPEISNELSSIQTNIRKIDSALIEQELEIAGYQAKLADLSIQFLNLRQFFKQSEREIKRKSWDKEVNYLWEPRSYGDQSSLREIFDESLTTNLFVLGRYLKLNRVFLGGCILVILLIYFFTRSIIKKVKSQKEYAEQILQRVQFLNKHLFVCSILVVIPFAFVFIENPTIVFSSTLSLVFVVLASLMIRARLPKYIFRLWVLFFPFYLTAPTFGLFWTVNYNERYLYLLVSFAGILMSTLILKKVNQSKFESSSLLKYLAIFLMAFSLFSLGLNVLGRVSLAKTYAVSGFSNFYRGMALYIFVQTILKLVYLWLEASKKETDVLTSFFDFQEIQLRIEGFLSIFAVALWFYSLTFYLGFFTPIYEYIKNFLTAERSLGNLEFEFATILLFFLIIIVAAFLANNIAYFASLLDQKKSNSRTRRLGSSVLLIRLAIIIIGFFIAMAAAKIPFDKITIVLGALSVGIGFGLQTIINNLVSGVILAFERPIQIGDDIQIGTQQGTVQEVGIRASKIRAYDGSEIVMPNGDLLSQSLINWTLSDKRRRIELIIGVAYSSDMKRVNEILHEVLSRDKILKNPAPKVLMQNFGDNSVDFRLLFWVDNMDIWIDLRSEVMNAIFEAFTTNQIEIPFPQRDLYLKTLPHDLKNIAQAVEVKESIQSPREVAQEKTQEEGDEERDKNKKSSED